MKMLRYAYLFLALLACLPLAATAQDAATSKAAKKSKSKGGSTTPCGYPDICGKERWPVKTLTDPDASAVTLTPVTKTVAQLYDTQAPAAGSGFDPARRADPEKQAYHVKARLVGYKQEFDPNSTKRDKGDRDFHIVIQDLQDATKTMIVEVPDPMCNEICQSKALAQVQQARKDFAAAFPNSPPSKEFVVVQGNVEVEVVGAGFFDFAHGQTGLAKNCMELHPVLSFKFSGSGPFQAKVDHQHEPPKHPKSFYQCIPESTSSGPHAPKSK